MGRPLKIAKAQAVVTITATNGTTEVVTTNANFTNLGIIAGMPFIPASSVGNLVGGTTYWILEVVTSGSNSTFTVSATPISANPTYTKFNLGTAGPVTVAATVGLVDSGFSNPNGAVTSTNSVSYGVVGGNTSLYGSQTLVRVAIGQAGLGNLLVSNNSAILNVINSTVDVSSYVNVGDWIGLDDSTAVGVVLGNTGKVVQNTVSSDALSGEITLDDSSTLVIEGAIIFGDDIGGLVGGKVYYVESKPSGTTITVSSTPGGTALTLTDDTVATTATQNTLTLSADSAVNANTDTWVYAGDEAGYILRQKGKTKYLVKGATTGLIGQCFTANVANAALTSNTMNILATYADTSTKYVKSLNDYQTEVFPTTVAASSLVGGTTYTIYTSGDTDWTAIGAASNMTGVTFVATDAGSGTGTAILANANPDVISTFNTAYAANTYGGQPNPIVTISNA